MTPEEQREVTMEVLEITEFEQLVDEPFEQLVMQPSVIRLLHKDGSYIRVKEDGYPQMGHTKALASVWFNLKQAVEYNAAFGFPFSIEEEK
jgi:hypothetical protein